MALFIRQTVSAAGPAGAAAAHKRPSCFHFRWRIAAATELLTTLGLSPIIRLEDSRIFESFTPEFAKERVIHRELTGCSEEK